METGLQDDPQYTGACYCHNINNSWQQGKGAVRQSLWHLLQNSSLGEAT